MTSWPGEGDGSGAAGSGAQAPPLDDVDRAIVAVLREDGRISMRALGLDCTFPGPAPTCASSDWKKPG